MNSLNKNRKFLFYPAGGILTLILLPVFVYMYLEKKNAFQTQKVIGFVIPRDEDLKCNPIPIRNYYVLKLDGNNFIDHATLEFARIVLHNILEAKDTCNGIKIHFGNQSEYWALVRVLDICRIEKASYYLLYKDWFWIFYINPKPKPERHIEPILM